MSFFDTPFGQIFEIFPVFFRNRIHGFVTNFRINKGT